MARILVIEDDEHTQATVRDVLTDLGHVVFVASNGREGLSRYREHQPDLVITDIFMPERDGLDVILDLAPTNVKIIAMSGGGHLGGNDHLDDAIHFGARRILIKPFTTNALVAAVNETLAP
jgi:two-component system, chemotaxis family, chemotaxis protein CheY